MSAISPAACIAARPMSHMVFVTMMVPPISAPMAAPVSSALLSIFPRPSAVLSTDGFTPSSASLSFPTSPAASLRPGVIGTAVVGADGDGCASPVVSFGTHD
ncbi:hypothetical protein D3C80_1595370 [compost metagenome]